MRGRRIGVWMVAMALLATGGTASADQASAGVTTPGWDIDPAGTPLVAVNIRGASMGHLPSGQPVVYAPTFGEPAKLSVLNGETGALLSSHDLGDKTTAIYTGISPDGSAYVAGQTPGANLFRYDPATDAVTDLGAPVPGETNISRVTTFAADGTLYSGTFPSGHVFSWSPATRAFTDFGPIAQGEQYARSMAFDGDRTLYVGTGTNARFFSIDVPTRTRTEIPIPAEYAGTQAYVNEMYYRDGLVFAFLSPAFAWIVYDTRTGTWRPSIPAAQAVAVTEAVDGQVYFIGQDANLHAYRLSDGTITRVTDRAQFSLNAARGLGVLHLQDPAWPGATITGIGLTGRMWHHNLTTGEFRWVWSEAVGGALKISALGFGPDSQLYAAGYLTPGRMARIDPASLAVTGLSGPQQAEFVGTVPLVDGPSRLYVGSYLDAGVWQYDEDTDWDYPRNPVRLARLDELAQERVLTVANASTRLAVGTLGRKGDPNGRLTIVDPRPGAERIAWSGTPVPDQSVASLLYQRVGPRPLLIGGTTSHQLGVEPVDPDGRIFLFDLGTLTVEHVMAPRPGADGISQIIQLPDGRIWALSTDSTVLELHVHRDDAGQYRIDVTEVASIFGTPRPAGSWSSPKLAVLDAGRVVGSAAGKVFTIDTATRQVTVVANGSHATPSPAGDGTFFYANLTQVYRARPDRTPPATTATVEGSNWATVTLTAVDDGAGVAGIEYRIDGGDWERYDEPIRVHRSKRVLLEYRATDLAGNVEPIRSITFAPGSSPLRSVVPPTTGRTELS